MSGSAELPGSWWTRIVTVRHGTTPFARLHRIAGTLDIPLSPGGEDESRGLRATMARLQPFVVVSSPLRRALETAILATGLDRKEIDVRANCAERDYGRMQGLDPELIPLLEPRVDYLSVGGIDHSLNPPDGESFPELRTRAHAFVTEILDAFAGRTIVVFSHQTFLQQMHGVLLNEDTFACLALDIGHLEMTSFELDEDGSLLDHHQERSVEDPDSSW